MDPTRRACRIAGATSLCASLLVLGLACRSGNESGPAADLAAGPNGSGLRFTDVSDVSGIDLENVCGGAEKTAIPETLGQGAAALDYDGDGLLDLFVVNGDVLPGHPARGRPRSALYRNLGELRFADVTAEAGLHLQAFAHGASAVDFDADGHPDLYVTVYFGGNRFFRNRGDGTFEDASTRWGGDDPGPSTAAAFFDADADGDLDLYVGNYVDYDPQNPPNHGQPCRWRGLIVLCGPKGTTPAADTFYENRGGRLIEASHKFGFDSVADSYTLGAVTGDFDEDHDVDLYVAVDSEPNLLFVNEGGGRFREAALVYAVDRNEDGYAQSGMGVDFGDIDNDGRFDIFVTNFSHDTNTLYHNIAAPDGGILFEDLTYRTGLAFASHRMLSWGTRIIDLDRDGWQDLVIVSGHVYPGVDEAAVGTSYAQPNQVFRSLGPNPDGRVTFEEFEAPPGSAFDKPAVSRGLVTADLDEDGDADLLVVEMDATPTLIRNDTEPHGHWIGFLLLGSGLNRDAIGARLELEDSVATKRWRERTSGAGYLSTSDPRLVFGLGTANGPIRSLSVRWPSGEIRRYQGLEPNRYWVLDETSPEALPYSSR